MTRFIIRCFGGFFSEIGVSDECDWYPSSNGNTYSRRAVYMSKTGLGRSGSLYTRTLVAQLRPPLVDELVEFVKRHDIT